MHRSQLVIKNLLLVTILLFPILAIGEETQADDAKKQQEILDRRAELDRLESQLNKQEEWQKRPKRVFVGARIRDPRLALYVKFWEEQIKKVGNSNYPQVAKDFRLYGSVQLTVSIKPDGNIEAIELDHSSGHKELDDAMIDIVKLTAPFNKFDEEMRKNIDILSITRTWTFTKG